MRGHPAAPTAGIAQVDYVQGVGLYVNRWRVRLPGSLREPAVCGARYGSWVYFVMSRGFFIL